VECHVAFSRIPADRFLIEKQSWILPEDAGVVSLQFRAYPAHDRHRETLRPAVPHQPEPVQKGEGLVCGKPHLHPAAWSLGTEEGVISALWVGRTWCPAKSSIRFKEALHSGAQVHAWFPRSRLQDAGNCFLDLITLVFRFRHLRRILGF